MKIDGMSDWQKRRAIAEAAGWKRCWNHNRQYVLYRWGEFEQHEKGTEDGELYHKDLSGLPDYLNDLNAMHEAEATVPYELQPVLLTELKRQVMRYERGVSDWDVYTATARQRADAFLLVLPESA